MALFKSKKFWMSVAGVVAVVLSNYFGWNQDQVLGVAGIIVSFVLGQGLADLGKEANKVEGPAE